MPPLRPPRHDDDLTPARVLRLWAPLAASWVLMAVELPLLTIVVARLADPKIHLAAYGSVVFPVSLVIEGPIIMLLAASTALCTNWAAYLKVRRFMLITSAVLTAVHVAVAFTPLFDIVARDILGAPEPILEPARLGLRIMTPWTWSIAYRRFQQGILIRNEHGRAVTAGTVVRLIANASVLGLGYLAGDWPGIVVGASAVATGVVAEAIWIGIRVQRVLRERVRPAPQVGELLTTRAFLSFYAPLALTPLITLFIQPLGAAAMARMPNALDSLAAWPAVHGLVFMTRALGMSYNEVVVSLVDRPGAVPVLRRVHRRLALAAMAVLVIVAATPLARLWFGTVSGLPEPLATLCRAAVALAVLMPGYAVLQSWYQGVLVRRRSTRAVTEAVALYLVLSGALLHLGVVTGATSGILWAVGSFTVAGLCQTGWLAWRSRDAIAHYTGDDAAPPHAQPRDELAKRL